MKPFDLEAAKRGEPLVTRDGRPVTEFHHFGGVNAGFTCAGVVNGGIRAWNDEGTVWTLGAVSPLDVFMAPRKRTVWVNLYSNGAGHHWDTEAEARQAIPMYAEMLILATAVPVEIEE